MALTNISKPTTTLTNSSKVSFGETWDTWTITWATETRTWDELSSLIDNTSKPTSTTDSFSVYPTTANRNDFTGAVGFTFTVTDTITITEIGRLYVSGNTQNHAVKLWRSTDTVTPIATGTILASSTSDSNGIKYISITPVTLVAGLTYAVAIDETNAGDQWRNSWNPSGFIKSHFTVTQAVYSTTQGTYPTGAGAVSEMYNVCVFKYTYSGISTAITNISKPS